MVNGVTIVILLFVSDALFAADSKPFIRQTDKIPKGPQNLSLIIGSDLSFDATAVGVRYAYRIVDNGFVKPINNSVLLEFSGMIKSYSSGIQRFYPLGGMRWDFHLHKDWTVFGMAESGLVIPLSSDDPRSVFIGNGVNVGGFYHFERHMALRLEISSLLLTQHVGITWKF